MTRRSAFTFIEVVVVMGILLVLVATLTPVYSSAKQRAQIVTSLSNLRQIHLGVKMYQMDYDGDGRYGTVAEMGLPDGRSIFGKRRTDKLLIEVPRSLWKSPCGMHHELLGDYTGEPDLTYIYFPVDKPDWTENAILYQENIRIATDINCNSPDIHLYNSFLSKRGLGVLLSGQLVNKIRKGNITTHEWWSLPAE